MRVFEFAAQWWKDRILKRDGNTDVGDPHLTFFQRQGMQQPDPVSFEKVQAFYDGLVKALKAAWEDRRVKDTEDQKLPFMAFLRVDYEPWGILRQLCNDHDIPKTIFPAKTQMFVRAWCVELSDPWESENEILFEDFSLLERGTADHYERCKRFTRISSLSLKRMDDYEAKVRKQGERYERMMHELEPAQLTHLREMDGVYRNYTYMLSERGCWSKDSLEMKGHLVEALEAYQLMLRERQEGLRPYGEMRKEACKRWGLFVDPEIGCS